MLAADVLARRDRHAAIMSRAFRRPRRHYAESPLRGTAPEYDPRLIDLWGDECEAAPDLCLPVLPDPEIGPDGILWGARVTMRACPPIDPECAFESRDPRPPVAEVAGTEPTGPVAEDVAAWLEGLGEPMTVADLADLTGHPILAVLRACRDWRAAGRVARQETRVEPLWLWRKAPR
jgi:hypothetical protein